ncbi:MAG: hypothetical protein IPN69_20880 [Acidobacteria bacterium]|nr:hypothetical protein [Acidobacteriota bacterium]
MRIAIMSLLIFSFGWLDCGTRLQLGWILPTECIHSKNKFSKEIKVGVDTFDPFIVDWIDDIEYSIAYDEKTREITYINTSDPDFITGNNLKVGSCLRLKREDITIVQGWEIYGPATNDGWYPVIGYNTGRPETVHETDIGRIVEEADPMLAFANSSVIEVRIRSFTKAK